VASRSRTKSGFSRMSLMSSMGADDTNEGF
jgi:hypothetical protein